jgi:hypothetical protein
MNLVAYTKYLRTQVIRHQLQLLQELRHQEAHEFSGCRANQVEARKETVKVAMMFWENLSL